jgi:peptidoglycan/LPS O-acetylase OafA/YrhL
VRQPIDEPVPPPIDEPVPPPIDELVGRPGLRTRWRYLLAVLYVPGLDGLRAVAVIVVVLFHAEVTGASGGFLGVSLFFTLSGFLITTLLLDEYERTDDISLRSFYARRARRLLPAAYLCLLFVVLVGGWWSAGQQRGLPGDLLASVANVANWRFAFASTSYAELFSAAPSPVAHFWSLAIEEQVYLVLPVVVVLALRRGRRALGGMIGALLLAAVVAIALTDDRNVVYNGTHTRAAEVLIGAAAAMYMVRRRAPDGTWSPVPWITRTTAAGALLAFGVLVVFASVEQAWIYRGGLPLVGLLSTVLVVSVVTGRLRVLDARALVAIGTMSYGIYLFHWPVFLLLDSERTGLDGVALFVVRSLVTGVLTMASYHLVEQPIRTGRRLRRPTILIPAAALGAVAIVVAALVVVPRPTVTETEQVLTLGAAAFVEFAPPEPSLSSTAPTPDQPTRLSREANAPVSTEPDLRVLVVGSDAGAVSALAGRPGLDVVDAVTPECLLMPAVVEGCTSLPERVAVLRALHDPSVIVIASGDGEASLAVSQNAAATDATALNELEGIHRGAIDAMLRVIDDAAATGVTVIVSSATGKQSPFYPRLSRVALVRPSVGTVTLSHDELVERVSRLTTPTGDAAAEDPMRLLVIGDSTSLSLAQAFNDGGDGRLAVLWAGQNGCAFALVTAIRSVPSGPWRQLECESYESKLPPLVASFRPDVVLLVSGPLEQTEQRYPGHEGGFVAGDPLFMELRERAMESLLAIVGPATPVLVADFPQIAVGEYASVEMLDPARLEALTAQVVDWDERWEQLERFDYRRPLEEAEAILGTLRSDGVHPDARQIEDLTRSTFAPQLIEQVEALRGRLAAATGAD